MKDTAKTRLQWVTTAKALCIIGVVLAHSPLSGFKNHFSVYALPVFFVIAGMFFKDDLSLPEIIRERFKRLMLPYGVFALVSYLIWLLFRQLLGWQVDINPFMPLVGILLGYGKAPWLAHNIPIWFIPCFYLALICFQAVKQYSKRFLPGAIALLAVLGFYLPQLLPFWLPWSAEVAVLACVFVGLGYLFKVWLKQDKPLPWLTVVLCIALNLAAFHFNRLVDLNYRHYGSFVWYYVGAISGVLLLFDVAKRLPANRVFETLGNQSLVILGLHSIGINLMYNFYYVLFHVSSLNGFHGLLVLFPTFSKLQVIFLYGGVVFSFLIVGLSLPLLMLFVYECLPRREAKLSKC